MLVRAGGVVVTRDAGGLLTGLDLRTGRTRWTAELAPNTTLRAVEGRLVEISLTVDVTRSSEDDTTQPTEDDPTPSSQEGDVTRHVTSEDVRGLR